MWNKFGDITINDPKSNSSTPLTYRAMAVEKSLNLKNIRSSNRQVGAVGQVAEELISQIAAMQELAPEEIKKVSIDSMPEGPYKNLLKKYRIITNSKDKHFSFFYSFHFATSWIEGQFTTSYS